MKIKQQNKKNLYQNFKINNYNKIFNKYKIKIVFKF